MSSIEVALDLGLEILLDSPSGNGGFIGIVSVDCLESTFSQGKAV